MFLLPLGFGGGTSPMLAHRPRKVAREGGFSRQLRLRQQPEEQRKHEGDDKQLRQ